MSKTVNDLYEAQKAITEDFLAVIEGSPLLRVLAPVALVEGRYTYLSEGMLPGIQFKDRPDSHHASAGIENPSVEYTIGFTAKRPAELAEQIENSILFGTRFAGLPQRILEPMIARAPGGRYDAKTLDEVIAQVDGASHIIISEQVSKALLALGILTEIDILDEHYEDLGLIIHDHDVQGILVANFSDSGVVLFHVGLPKRDKDGQLEWLVSLGVVSGRAAALYAPAEA